MAVELSVRYSANREIRLGIGLAVNRGRKKIELPTEEDGFSLEEIEQIKSVTRHKKKVSTGTPDLGGESEKPGWGGLPRERKYGKAQRAGLLQAGAVCDQWFGTEALFLTGTLPGSTPESLENMARWSGYICNRVKTWIRRRMSGEIHDFYTWEWQKRGALHLHYCVVVPSYSLRIRLNTEFHDFWCQILEDITVKSGVDMFQNIEGWTHRWNWERVQADGQFVEKSVAAYFSKYASKGEHEKMKKCLSELKYALHCPAKWVGWSRPVSHKIAQTSYRFKSVGSRRSIEEKYYALIDPLMKLQILTHIYEWKNLPGKTRVLYFNTENLLEVQEIISEIMTPEMRYKPLDSHHWFERVRANPTKLALFRKWFYSEYGNPLTNWKAASLTNNLDGKQTVLGVMEFYKLIASCPEKLRR